ncbi:LysR family transcriptional regulator [Lentilactobacillus senioris]|uniref:Transcriptional regulator, LysR family n=1 Tax=Lentilactobacillus senioris DSM 24302 = JCM 17472 TaxID=1423802 RepID=A0A0R2CVZ6_9LACO|nr:LysR family transcriptional regulator [Lentilactobacillus senioris]KRM93860.1 transcriptional regulator, LysR family [Lentilactobacillus senioris DSM 24302 = JCM 17472]
MKTTQENIFSSKTLSYFLQLSDTMNYTQAAQILGITQPALTQQIKKLERTVGAPLFYSVGKKLRLTEAGHTMLRTTHDIYELLNEATDEIQQSSSETTGEINLGILASIETRVLQAFAIELYKEYPDLTISFHMLTRKEIWENLENNKIDLAIMYLPDSSIKNWQPYSSKKILSDELMYVHHQPELKDRKYIRFKDVTDSPWVIYPQNYFLNATLHDAFKNQMVDFPKIAGRFTLPEQLLNFAIHANTATALPVSFLKGINSDFLEQQNTWMTTLEPKVQLDLSFVFRKNKNEIPRIKFFLDAFDKYLKDEDYLSRLEKIATKDKTK